jgi:hypothetical protein
MNVADLAVDAVSATGELDLEKLTIVSGRKALRAQPREASGTTGRRAVKGTACNLMIMSGTID